MTTPAIDPQMVESLAQASSLQLYQLKSLIEGLLADPRRNMSARSQLHLGQAVEFVDFRTGQMRLGKIIALKDTQATVMEAATRRSWKLPCLGIQGHAAPDRSLGEAPYEPPPEPKAPPGSARAFQKGDTVTFEDRSGRGITGVVMRINPQTATVGVPSGETWRVPFKMLRQVVDI
jgi:hypothetical protein